MAQARVTEEIAHGTCFLPFHWGREQGFSKAANSLTVSARDPISRQPDFRACAIRVRNVMDFPLEDNQQSPRRCRREPTKCFMPRKSPGLIKNWA
jgi:predicted molibdopterin-dependent oxidoreductase YjgC